MEVIFMKKLVSVIAIGALCTVGALAETIKGTVSDSMCGAKHVAGTAKDAECVATCLKDHGADPVIISDGKVLKIAADSKEKVMPHLGHKVTITGTIADDTVTIESIKM
jgi:hypothetical protein